MTQDISYYESGYIENGYYDIIGNDYFETGYFEDGYLNYTADASASFNLTCSIITVIGVIKNLESQLTSSFTQTCILSNLKGADLFAFSNASLNAEVARIRTNNTQIDSVANISASGLRVKYLSANYDIDAAIFSSYERIRTDEAAINAAFSLSTDFLILSRFDSNLISSFETTISVSKFVNLNSAVTCISDLSILITKYIDFNIWLNLESDTQIVNSRSRNIDSRSDSNLVLTSIVTRIIEFNVVCESLFSPNIEALCLVNHDAYLESNATLTLSVNLIKNVSSVQSCTFTQSVINQQIRELVSNQNSAFTITATGTFGNKRPISAYPVGSSIVFNNYRSSLGGYSLQLPAQSTGQYVRIEHRNNKSITTGQAFYLSIFATLPVTGTIPNNTTYPVFKDSNNNLSISFTNTSGTLGVIYKVGVISQYQALTWASTNNEPWVKFEVCRSTTNGQLIFFDTSSGHFNYITNAAAVSLGTYFTINGYSSGLSHVDEAYLTIGYENYGPNQIYDPLRNQNPSDPNAEFLFHFNNNYNDDKAGTYSGSAILSNQASMVTNAGKSIVNQASLSSNAILVCNPIFLPLEFSAELIAEFTESIIPEPRIRTTESNLQAFASQLSIIGAIEQNSIVLLSNTTMYSNPIIITDSVIELTNLLSITSILDITRNVDSELITESTIDLVYEKIVDFSSHMNIDANQVSTISITKYATSDLTLFASELVAIIRISDYFVNLEVNSSLNSIATIESRITLNLESRSNIVINAERIRDNDSALVSYSDLSIEYIRLFEGFPDVLYCPFEVQADVSITTSNSASLTLFASELVAIGRIGDFFVNLEVNSTVICNPVVTKSTNINLQSNVVLASSIKRIKGFDSNINSNFVLNCTLTKIIKFNLIATSAFSTTLSYIRIHNFNSNQSSQFALNSNASYRISSRSLLSVTANVLMTQKVIKEYGSNQSSISQLNCTIKRIRTNSIVQLSQMTLTNQLIRIRKTNSNLQAFVSQLTAITKKINEVCSMNVTSELFIDPIVIIGKKSFMQTNFTLTADFIRTKFTSVNLQSTINLTSSISIIKHSDSELIISSNIVAYGSKLYLDPLLTYVIPSEDRTHTIEQENRNFVISYEDRTYIIGN